MIIIKQTTFGETLSAITAAVHQAFPGAIISVREFQSSESFTCSYDIHIKPIGEPGFSVSMGKDQSSISLDGLYEQNVRAAIAIRDAVVDTDPVILVHPETESYADLIPGMTHDAINSSWHSWDDLDPEIWN